MNRKHSRQALPARNSRARSGFTLIEVLLVVVIIGILVGVVAPKFAGRAKQARIQGTRMTIKAVSTALDVYEVDNGKYPGSLQNLLSQSGELNWQGPYLKDGRMPLDTWGLELRYTAQNTGYKISSAGPDGQMGSADDITN